MRCLVTHLRASGLVHTGNDESPTPRRWTHDDDLDYPRFFQVEFKSFELKPLDREVCLVECSSSWVSTILMGLAVVGWL